MQLSLYFIELKFLLSAQSCEKCSRVSLTRKTAYFKHFYCKYLQSLQSDLLKIEYHKKYANYIIVSNLTDYSTILGVYRLLASSVVTG